MSADFSLDSIYILLKNKYYRKARFARRLQAESTPPLILFTFLYFFDTVRRFLDALLTFQVLY